MSDAQIANFAHTAIHAVAHLGDHLRRFARQADLNPDDVDSTIEGSQELKVLIDLSNNDKHGYPPRDGGKSGISPRVLKFRRSLRVSTGPGEGETVGVVLTANGPVLEGSGSAAVVITGEVVDKKGSVVGHVDKYLEAAAAQWEALLKKWKVSV